MSPKVRTAIAWSEIYGESVDRTRVVELVSGLNRVSALTTLSRINILLAVDRFRGEVGWETKIQSYLAGTFLSDEVLGRLKEKFGFERLDVRSLFHSQQVLLLSNYIAIHSADVGGAEPENDPEARMRLGTGLLLVSDLLVPVHMAASLRNRSIPRVKQALLLQLSASSGMEVNNPPDLMPSLVRSDVLFGRILESTPSQVSFTSIFKERKGLEINEFLDFNVGVLVNYLTRSPQEFMETAGINFLNPKTFFAGADAGSVENFWRTELTDSSEYRVELTSDTKVAPHHNFTAYRKQPFFRITDESCIVVHPCFVQEKLEIGLFWEIFHCLEGSAEKDALFNLWGRIFETYINERLVEASNGKAKYVSFPKYEDNGQEAFDGLLINGHIALVFECKAGFLKAECKYSDDPNLLLPDLDLKFGSSKTGAVKQLASNITQAFAAKSVFRRSLQGIDFSDVKTIVPVLVVQERFVNTPMMQFVLADLFRGELRKQRLTREIGVHSQGLIVVDAHDVEGLWNCSADPQFHLSDCLFRRSLLGDVVLDFGEFLRQYARDRSISLQPRSEMVDAFKRIFERISKRFFGRPLDDDSRSSPV